MSAHIVALAVVATMSDGTRVETPMNTVAIPLCCCGGDPTTAEGSGTTGPHMVFGHVQAAVDAAYAAAGWESIIPAPPHLASVDAVQAVVDKMWELGFKIPQDHPQYPERATVAPEDLVYEAPDEAACLMLLVEAVTADGGIIGGPPTVTNQAAAAMRQSFLAQGLSGAEV